MIDARGGTRRSPGWLRWLFVVEIALALLIGVFLAMAPGLFSSVQVRTPATTVIAVAFGPALVTVALALIARAAWRRGLGWLAGVLPLVPPLLVVASIPTMML